MEDNITFTLPDHTEENPVTHVESMRTAISEAYHANWRRHSAAQKKDKKDDDAGRKLPRTRPSQKSRAKGGAGKG